MVTLFILERFRLKNKVRKMFIFLVHLNLFVAQFLVWIHLQCQVLLWVLVWKNSNKSVLLKSSLAKASNSTRVLADTWYYNVCCEIIYQCLKKFIGIQLESCTKNFHSSVWHREILGIVSFKLSLYLVNYDCRRLWSTNTPWIKRVLVSETCHCWTPTKYRHL
jgi:hypothetical protein